MLTIVPTPIGNLEDITLRALEALKSADVIAAEDTRHSGILLKHFEISKPFVSYHEHNEASRTAELTVRMAEGLKVALITDAGMPGISDPGQRLIRACIEKNLPFTVLPGPCAAITGIVGSGLAGDSFYYGGFLPVKSGRRMAELTRAVEREQASVYYESPYRLVKSLAVLEEIAPGRTVCVARELSKKFEEYRRGEAKTLRAHYEAHPPKGEICLIIGEDNPKKKMKDDRDEESLPEL